MKSASNPWIILAATWLLSMGTNFQVFAPAPLLGILISDLKLTHTEAGLLVALPPLMYVLLSISGGLDEGYSTLHLDEGAEV